MSQNGRKGFTLIEMLMVIVVISILALIVIPRLLHLADRDKYDQLCEQVAWDSHDQAAYEQAAKILLAEDPSRVTDYGWLQRAVGHGYAGRDPRQGGSSWQTWRSNLRFRPWNEVQASNLPPSRNVWAYEVLENRTSRYSTAYAQFRGQPPFLCRTRLGYTDESVQHGRTHLTKGFERVCLVLMADGSTKLCGFDDLERLGLVQAGEEVLVWTDEEDPHPPYLTYMAWQKELLDRPRKGSFGNTSWVLLAACP